MNKSEFSVIAPATLDLRGQKCPMPVLKTRSALKKLAPGNVLEVLTTDPMAAIDVPHLLQQSGDILLDQSAEGTHTRFLIQKSLISTEQTGSRRG